MSTQPLVSVVTSTYNGARYLEESLRTVLDQRGVDLELVVVDDGSIDATPRILERLCAEDARVRVIRQENQGLTRALVHGCAQARGAYIARHDSDDESLPGRLEAQAAALSRDPALALVSCFSHVIGPQGELLHLTTGAADPQIAMRELRAGTRGPAGHGSAMFRAETYRAVGGYRPAFRFAQDWDLWLRLTEHGNFAFVPQVLYRYRVGENSISASRRLQQNRLGQIAMQCAQARASGAPEAVHLREAEQVSSESAPPGRAQSNSYFIASCLLKRGDLRGLRYLWNAMVASTGR